MVYDLGLDRTIGDADVPEMLGDTTKSFSAETHRNGNTRTMEERRTMLSVYFLTSLYVTLRCGSAGKWLTSLGCPGA